MVSIAFSRRDLKPIWSRHAVSSAHTKGQFKCRFPVWSLSLDICCSCSWFIAVHPIRLCWASIQPASVFFARGLVSPGLYRFTRASQPTYKQRMCQGLHGQRIFHNLFFYKVLGIPLVERRLNVDNKPKFISENFGSLPPIGGSK